MNPRNLDELSDEELLVEAKRMKCTAIINAILIGFLIGIIIYSVLKNSVGFFTLIPLYFIYKFFNKSKR